MDVLDYRTCFVFSTSAIEGVEQNTCRTQILAQCDLANDETGFRATFYLGKACIGEHMYMEGGIAQIPTSEVCVVFSEGRNMLVKKFADHDNDLVQIGSLGDKHRLFDGRYAYGISQRVQLERVPSRLLASPDDIIQATLDAEPMVGRTTIRDEGSGWWPLIEFPVVYMNVHPPTRAYQVDVGPVLFPDFTALGEDPLAGLQLAYILYNGPDQAEFAVRVPTRVADDREAVTLHYSHVVHASTTNELYSLSC